MRLTSGGSFMAGWPSSVCERSELAAVDERFDLVFVAALFFVEFQAVGRDLRDRRRLAGSAFRT